MSPNETLTRSWSARAPLAPVKAAPPTDPTFAIREQLLALASTLASARRFRDACARAAARSLQRQRRWAEGALFSLDPELHAQWQQARPPEHSITERFRARVARRMPAEADAWDRLDAQVAQAQCVLVDSLLARRVARALPGLVDEAAALAADHPSAQELADLLAVMDDVVFQVLHPESGTGFRVLVQGIENTFQLHVLLADLLTGPAGGLPAERPDRRVVDAYRRCARPLDGLVAEAAFGMYAAGALRTDGTLPEGMTGCDYWLWGASAPTAIPYFDGERVILLGDPPFRMTWEVDRRYPALAADVRLVECLEPATVRDWLARLRGAA